MKKPDEAELKAAELLECRGCETTSFFQTNGGVHAGDCLGRLRPAFAARLRKFKQQGREEGIEAACKAICWMCRKDELPWCIDGDWVHDSVVCPITLIYAALAKPDAPASKEPTKRL